METPPVMLCPECGKPTTYLDPVTRLLRCPCGWRDKP
jgi:DNA-directed RNA polymerase subunit RPC12/RpoP